MKNIQKTALAMLMVVLLVTASIPLAWAYDSSAPYTVTINYIVPVDTTFTVTLAAAQIDINFEPVKVGNVGASNAQNVEPTNQSAASSIATAEIINAGNVAQTFSMNLTAAQFSYVVVIASNNSDYSNPVTLSDSAQSPTEWANVAASGTVALYLQADFTDAPLGTTSKTLQINTIAS